MRFPDPAASLPLVLSMWSTLGISGGAQRRPLHAVVELNPPSADRPETLLGVRFSPARE
jgi:hypothetical protein